MSKKDELDWFLPDHEGNGTDGPYSTEQIINMIKEKKIMFDDYIASPQFKNETWLRIYECPQFKLAQKALPLSPPPKLFKENKNDTIQENIHRSSAQIQEKIIIHNNHIYAYGEITEIAADYLSAKIIEANSEVYAEIDSEVNSEIEEKNKLNKGEEVSVTLYDSEKIPSLSLQGVIIDKKNRGDLTTLKLYYLKINPEVRRKINHILTGKL